jgi:hypothetical protein
MATACDVSDIVTLDYRNRNLWGELSGPLSAPRWIRVQIVSREANRGLAAVAEDKWIGTELLNVRFARCACGIEFAFGNTLGDLPRCKSCDQRERMVSQRNRRMRQRASELAQVCAHCGGGLVAQRRTRKYCSGACRVAALRESRG